MIHERRGRPAPAMEPQLELRRPSRLSTARWARVEGLWRSALGEAADVVGAVSSRRRARLWLRPVRHTPVGAVPYPGLPCPVEFRCGEGDRALRPRPGGRLDPLLCDQSPGVTRATEGQRFAGRTGPYAAGPDVRRSRGSLPSLGLPSGLRTVATIHAVREVDCLDASSLRPCSSNAAHTRAGKGRFDARPGNCKSVPVRGWMSPTSPRLFQLRPHAVTSRRDRAANVRAGVPSAGDGRPGRPTIG